MIDSRSLPRVLGLVAPVAALTALSFAAAPQGPPSAVRVDAVREEVLANRRPVTGSLRAARRGEVAAREKGLVVELLADEGSRVATGDVLARLDATQLELDLVVLRADRPPAEATVRERTADLTSSRNDLESVRKLVERKAANPKELVDAETAVAAAEARLAASEAGLAVIDARIAKLEQRIVDMTILAPFDGTVVARMTEVGSWLSEGASVVELLSTEDLEVWLEVPQDLYGAVIANPGPIEVRLGAGRDAFALTDYLVIPDVAERGRTFRLMGDATTDLPISAGMSVIAMVPTSEEKAMLTLHRDAILYNQVGPYVYSVVPGGEGQPASAAPTPVEVLFQTPTRAVVRSAALRAGAQVVVEGNERLHPMAPIIPHPIGGAPAGNGGGEPAPAKGGDGAPAKNPAKNPAKQAPKESSKDAAGAPAKEEASQR